MAPFMSSACLARPARDRSSHPTDRPGIRLRQAIPTRGRLRVRRRGAHPTIILGICGLLVTADAWFRVSAQEAARESQASAVPGQDALAPPTEAATETETVYSGPQPGEPLARFSARVIFGGEAGEAVDVIERADKNPLLLLFVHEVTRPSIAVVRAIAGYATSRAEDGLCTAIIFLTGDVTETEAFLQRARHAMPPNVLIGISQDGLEGPGEYGLNRNVALTILVGKERETMSNFALIQPSLQTDVIPVIRSVIDVLGSGVVPPLEHLLAESERMVRPGRSEDVSEDRIRSLLQPLIRASASAEDVERIAAVVQRELEADPALQRRIGEIATRIVAADKLENYGTPAAQAVLRRWAEQFGPTAEANSDNETARESPRRNDSDSSE